MKEPQTYIACNEHLWCKIGSDAAILNVSEGIYFGLNETAATIWAALKEPTTLQSITELVVQQFQVTQEQASSDVSELLREMLDSGLVKSQEPPC